MWTWINMMWRCETRYKNDIYNWYSCIKCKNNVHTKKGGQSRGLSRPHIGYSWSQNGCQSTRTTELQREVGEWGTKEFYPHVLVSYQGENVFPEASRRLPGPMIGHGYPLTNCRQMVMKMSWLTWDNYHSLSGNLHFSSSELWGYC